MLGAALGIFTILGAYGPNPPADNAHLTVWWRTAGAEAIEERSPNGGGSCSLILNQTGDMAVLMWPLEGAPALFVRDPAWSFGNQQRGVQVDLVVGPPGDVASTTTELAANAYQNWIKAPLDQAVAAALPGVNEFSIAFPGGQATSASFPLDQTRMANVRRGLARCKTTLAREG